MNDLSDIKILAKQVEELMHEKQSVLSIVSHDIRSPLNRVFALTQLLQMNSSNLTVEQRDYLEKMNLVIADGLAMMRNLVDYRNLEYRNIELHVETFDACDLIETSMRNFNQMVVKKNIEVEVELENNLLVTTDKLCLSRVIDNLLSNAFKFSSPGKKVWVRANSPVTDHLKFEVQDEAPGFLQDEMPKLFHKFQKLSARPTAGESSTGLGLYVAKWMAEKIGGKINCVTQEKAGSTFSLELPKESNHSNK